MEVILSMGGHDALGGDGESASSNPASAENDGNTKRFASKGRICQR